MYKRPFFRFLIFVFLISLQTFVYAVEDIPGLEITKKQIDKLIDSGKSSAAAAMEDKIIADNSKHPDLPKIISDMADDRAKLPCHDYGRAKALYKRLIKQCPQNNYAKRAGLEVSKIDIFSKMETGKLKSAGGDVEQMIAGNSDNPYLSEALYDVAVRYTKRYYFDRADALYNRLIELCPADSFTEKAKFEQIKNNLFSKFKRGESVDGILNDTVAQYPNHKHLPRVLYFAADKYEENYNYEKAKALYKQTLMANPDSSYGRKSTLELVKVDIYEKISDGDFASAHNLTEKLITEHPTHPYLPEVLYNIADYYRKCRNHKRAKQVYSRLIALYPEDRFSARGQVEMALLDIRSKMSMGTFDPAAGELERFINGRQKDYLLARRCYELGYNCAYAHDYESAISVLETVCRQFSEYSYYYGRAKIRYGAVKICKDIKAGNLTEAQKGIKKLKNDYAGCYYMSGQLYFIARVYLHCGYPDQSSALCDDVISMGQGKYVTHSNMFKSRLNIHSRLKTGDLAGAKQIVSEFKSKYAGSLHLTEGILELAEEFYTKGLHGEGDNADYLKETIAICQGQETAETDFQIQSLRMLADSYFKLGDFAKSASYYQKIVDEYPDSYSVWHIQFMVGRAYQRMLKAGGISEEQEAVGRIKTAYQKLLENYPDCQAAKIAQRWLGNHN